MKMWKRKSSKAISTMLTLSLVLGIFSGILPAYAEEAEPVEVAVQNGPTQYLENGVSEENSSGESLENVGDSNQPASSQPTSSQPVSSQPASSQPASSQPTSLEVSSNEGQTQGGDSDSQPYTAYTTDSSDAAELVDRNDLVVTNDAVSQVSSSEDTVISTGSGERPAEAADQKKPILRMARKRKVPTSISSSSYISTWKETIKKSGSSISNTMTDVSTNFTTKTAKTTYSFKPLIDKVPMYCLTTSPYYFTSTTILHTTYVTKTNVSNTETEIKITNVDVTLGIPLTFWDADGEGYYLFPVFGNTANTSEVYAPTTLPVLTSQYDASLHSSYCAKFHVEYKISKSSVYTTEISTYLTWATDENRSTYWYVTSDTNIVPIGITRFTTIETYAYEYGWLNTYTITNTCIGLTVLDPIYKQIIPDNDKIQRMISSGKPDSGTDVYIETDISEGDIYWMWGQDFSSVWDYDKNPNMAYIYYTLSMDTDGNYTTVPSITTSVYGVMKSKLDVTGSIHTRVKLGQWFVTTIYEDEIITRTQKLVPTTIYWENEEEVIHSTVLWKYAVIYQPLSVHTESVQTGNVMRKPMAIKADKPVTQNFTVLNAAVSPKGGGGHAVETGDESLLYLNLLLLLSSAASICIWFAVMRKRSAR